MYKQKKLPAGGYKLLSRLMDINTFYKKMDEVFELDLGAITGKESLSDSGLVDSLSMLGLISLLDKEFGVQMSPKEIVQTGTIDDLFCLICNGCIKMDHDA